MNETRPRGVERPAGPLDRVLRGLARRLAATGVAASLCLAAAATEAAAGRSDRALYLAANASRDALKKSTRRMAKRAEWEKVVMRYRLVVARYPQSGYCDNALLAVGDLYREMARRFKFPRYGDDAIQAYRALVTEYPSSSLGEGALFSAFEIAQATGQRRRVADAGRTFLAAFPDSRRAAVVKAALERRVRGAPQEAALPSPPPPGLAQLFNVRFWSGESSTRVVLDLERRVPIQHDRISDPDRLWIDLEGTRLHPNLTERSFPVGDGLLEQIRVAKNRDRVVRVVLDFKDVKDHSVFFLENPLRLVVDVRAAATPMMASAATMLPSAGSASGAGPAPSIGTSTPSAGSAAPSVGTSTPSAGTSALSADTSSSPLRPPAPLPEPLPPKGPVGEEQTPHNREDPGKGAPAASPDTRTADTAPPVERLPGRRVATILPPATKTPPRPRTSPPWQVVVDGTKPARPAPKEEPAPVARDVPVEPSPPTAPQTNRAGSYSLVRQLGLGARKIVIDAGHGGHDPGSIGRGGLQEKDLVLDVALRLEKMVRAELGAEVVMTRSTDVFIPLEERTAIANSRGADLFLSIHANSSRNPRARGIETYFLSFAADRHAEEVAARENAISAATLKDLQNLVRAIALNAKIDESRDFAASVQEAMVRTQRAHEPRIPDRGVRTAPFYVLIGANMPSVLAEIAFVSHPEEERRLRTADHRDRIARSLLQGVEAYLEALNRTQMRQLTGSSRRSRVATKGAKR